jgi:hypothetical protein
MIRTNSFRQAAQRRWIIDFKEGINHLDLE